MIPSHLGQSPMPFALIHLHTMTDVCFCICIYDKMSLFYSYSEVTVATRIQYVSRSDGGFAPRDDIYSPEC